MYLRLVLANLFCFLKLRLLFFRLSAYSSDEYRNTNMITSLKIIFVAIFVWITYIVISTSLESSLFKEWDFLGSIPWMRATLWDFYANIFIITLWMFYKEKSLLLKIVWLILFVCLGAIATSAYVLIKLFNLKDGEGVKELVGNKC
ncbi:DUF1475 domain-containing protein [Pedobacter cryotolerans]|uniref:DUF1475 domain-containing protein n=1 Tax=Pedobacter cryotolerans TaxID=2571270 RepID=A0A4U1BWC1_9SPHI|nr:DUF1475 domain-containing protein [Pedobacter cryotolerans]